MKTIKKYVGVGSRGDPMHHTDEWVGDGFRDDVHDGTFVEDASRTGSGNAPIALTHIRDVALSFIRRCKLSPERASEVFAGNPEAAVRAMIRYEVNCTARRMQSVNCGS